MSDTVRNNNGSADFQLRLVEWARQCGWSESRIAVIDDDLGVSRASTSPPTALGAGPNIDVPEIGESSPNPARHHQDEKQQETSEG